MALIKYGGGVAGASGSVAGNTYSRNRAGAYIRNWAKPINPGTISQSENRSSFGSSSTGWGDLTKAQVDAWNAYANDLERVNALGETYTPLGRQIFMEANRNLFASGTAALVAPGPSSTKPSIDTLSAVAGVSDTGVLTTLTMTGVTVTIPSGGTGRFVLQGAPPHGPEKSNVNNQYRQIALDDPTDLAGSIFTGYTEVFGTAASSGQIIDVRYRVVDPLTGLSSPWVKGRAILTEAP